MLTYVRSSSRTLLRRSILPQGATSPGDRLQLGHLVVVLLEGQTAVEAAIALVLHLVVPRDQLLASQSPTRELFRRYPLRCLAGQLSTGPVRAEVVRCAPVGTSLKPAPEIVGIPLRRLVAAHGAPSRY